MNMRNAVLVFPLVVSVLSGISSFAQTIPEASAPKCVDIPGFPCPGSSSGSTSHRVSSATSMRYAMTQELAATLAAGFLKMLFSNDTKAAAQRQKMMEELAQRQAEAERQQKFEEAKRLQAICDRLSATLKLSGLPGLQLKGAPSAGLRLKLGDSSGDHVGIRGLPGIALNDNTGNGGTKPYGIQGLPGIYTNGPGSGNVTFSESKLSLKTDGEDAPAVPPGAPTSEAPTAQTSTDSISQDLADALRNPQNMTPQQLADAATLVGSLPPEEQQRLMNAAAANLQTANDLAQSTAPAVQNQPALSQLQQVASTSQSAASAKGLEDAAAQARAGFDQGLKVDTGATAPQPLTGSHVANATLPPANPAASHASSSAGGTRSSIGTTTPTVNLATGQHKPKVTPATPATAPTKPVARAGCPPGVERIIPSRQQLLTELAVRHSQMESLRNTIMRLNRTIQLDQQQFAVWQEEAEAGLERVKARRTDLITGALFDSFVESKEKAFEALKEQGKLTAFDQEQWRRLKLAKDIKSFDDFRKWALQDKSNWGMIEDGARLLVDHWPLSAEATSYVRCGKALIDNAYDYAALAATWENVQQLDRNSNQFLNAVRQNGERMKALVERIHEIQTQLNATPELPPSISPCLENPAQAKVQ